MLNRLFTFLTERKYTQSVKDKRKDVSDRDLPFKDNLIWGKLSTATPTFACISGYFFQSVVGSKPQSDKWSRSVCPTKRSRSNKFKDLN